MSENETDKLSAHDSDNEIPKLQEDSGSEYQSEDNQKGNDDSDDEAKSVRSESSSRSGKFSTNGSAKRSTARKYAQSKINKPSKATYSDAYRDLYNEHIEELAHPFLSRAHGLPASQIGVTVWTPREKEIFFRNISTLGKNNIKAVSEAIKTKAEPEVRQYLSLLDQGTVEGNLTLALPVFSAADVSAAVEVSKQSEDLLEEYADGLAKYQLKNDQKREKKRHGDYWLLTDEIAEELEEEIMTRDRSYMKSEVHDEEQDEVVESAEDGQDNPDEYTGEVEFDQDGSEAGTRDEQNISGKKRSKSQQSNQESAEPTEELVVPAAELLDLPMWLRLSPLFMHQPPETGGSWTNFVTSHHETPSMYHTAFQDFHNLTVSLTRRLVQATIFQTMTRLRARDKDQPSTTITSNDVRTAAEILDLKPNMRKFWSGVPRKHGLRVYERNSKFAKGQSRAGAELSLEEAEQRMSVGQTSTVNAEANGDIAHTVESRMMEEDVLDPDQYYDDAELWTEDSESEDEAPVPILDDQESNASGDKAADDPSDSEEAQAAALKKQNRQGRMEQRFQKAHDTYLEAMDQEISRLQEVEMWKSLGVSPPKEIKDEEIEVPRQPVIKRRFSDTLDWREGLEYQPPWERGFVDVRPEDFANMHKRGEQARKRRQLAYDNLEQRGLITLPLRMPEATIVRKKMNSTNTDVEMEDAPAEEAVIPTTETFEDGVPRKKHPNPILSRVQSRASSIRESSHDSSRSASANPKGSALADRLLSRAPIKQIDSAVKRAEEELRARERLAAEKQQTEEETRTAEELAKEDKRKARAARKGLSEEEKQAIAKEKSEERRRNKKAQREQEKKQKIEEEKQRNKEEKQRLKEEEETAKVGKRKSKQTRVTLRTEGTATPDEEQEQSMSPEDAAHENVVEQKAETKDEQEKYQEDTQTEQSREPTQSTRPRSKKPKRKSGF